MNVIEVNNLTKKFNNNTVVKGVSFKIGKGEIIGFLGRNGAGKTTTINMLCGITLPSEGSFSILGYPNTEIDSIKKHIGVLPDAANYYYDMNAMEHLAFFAELKKVKTKRDALITALDSVGLNNQYNKKIGGFSFGMKKKLGIAQALIGEPELIFLDEPTSGLDPESAIEIKELVQRLCKNGRTIFLTSHNLNEVETLCSKIYIMADGRISKYGTMQELKGKYQNAISLLVTTECISDELASKLRNDISDYCEGLMISEKRITCSINDYEYIPLIVFALSKNNIKVYKLEHKEASLEDIFLDRAMG